MTAVIDTLVQLASDASLQNSSATDQLLIDNKIDKETINAIVSKDVTKLERQLDVCPDIVCILVPAEDEDSEENTDDKTDSLVA